jgi:Helix-turn-helix
VFRPVYPAHIADDDLRPPTLGELIRRQRELAALPLRQVAVAVGISNAYLSQIERNLSVNPVNVSSGRSPTSWGCRRPS